jgi:hypothetical protein
VDRTGSTDVNHHDFPEDGGKPHVHLLYKPGHYDVLYKAECWPQFDVNYIICMAKKKCN